MSTILLPSPIRAPPRHPLRPSPPAVPRILPPPTLPSPSNPCHTYVLNRVNVQPCLVRTEACAPPPSPTPPLFSCVRPACDRGAILQGVGLLAKPAVRICMRVAQYLPPPGSLQRCPRPLATERPPAAMSAPEPPGPPPGLPRPAEPLLPGRVMQVAHIAESGPSHRLLFCRALRSDGSTELFMLEVTGCFLVVPPEPS